MSFRKYLKIGYLVVILAMLVHVCVGATIVNAGLGDGMGWLSFTNILYYVPALVILELVRLFLRFRQSGSRVVKVCSVTLMAVHILCLFAFLMVNVNQLHMVSSYGCILLFGSLFGVGAFYPICVITAYCTDAVVRLITSKKEEEL